MMKRTTLYSFAALGGIMVATPLALLPRSEVIRPGTFVGPVDVSNLPPTDAERAVRAWWEKARREPVEVTVTGQTLNLEPVSATTLGVSVDDVATVAALPRKEWTSELGAITGQAPTRTSFRPVLKTLDEPSKPWVTLVQSKLPKPTPASVRFVNGQIVRKAEGPSIRLDVAAIPALAVQAVESDRRLILPIEEAPKRVPDEELNRIREVVASFSTTFPASNRPRSTNIRLATESLNGKLLMPGDRLSFNGTVGPRTTRRGYREAGVYVNGRHDTGVGGGICQVSTTLYNAALLSDLKIVQRQNHSMPVPYVPLGRDAVVSYGSLDIVIENSTDHPIAISGDYRPGRVTFRVLGEKQPGQEVKITTANRRSLGQRTKTVRDSRLPAGRTRVIERGSAGYSILTYRNVYVNGQLQRREPLGRSYYPGGPRIVAVGSRSAPAAVRRPNPPAPTALSAPRTDTPAPAPNPDGSSG
jgi:vancomycin resistance protein YoaR